MSSHSLGIAFDERAISGELQKLSFETLQHVLDLVLNDRSRLPFNIFLCHRPPTRIARGTDQVLIGLSFSAQSKSSVAA